MNITASCYFEWVHRSNFTRVAFFRYYIWVSETDISLQGRCHLRKDEPCYLDKTVIKIFVSGSQLMFHISDVCNSETPELEFVDLVKTNPGYQVAQPTECTFCLILVFIFRFPPTVKR